MDGWSPEALCVVWIDVARLRAPVCMHMYISVYICRYICRYRYICPCMYANRYIDYGARARAGGTCLVAVLHAVSVIGCWGRAAGAASVTVCW